MFVSRVRETTDHSDERALAVDVVFHPWVLRCCKGEPLFRDQVSPWFTPPLKSTGLLCGGKNSGKCLEVCDLDRKRFLKVVPPNGEAELSRGARSPTPR